MLSGGGAQLHGLDSLVRKETGMSVNVAENPLECVVTGVGRALDQFEEINRSQYSRRY
jgi:rod shape-determining protein MreB